MTKNEALKTYKETNERIRAYSLLIALCDYDRQTIAPKKGIEAMNKALSRVVGDLYEIQTDSKYLEAVNFLSKTDLGEAKNREIYLSKKLLDDLVKFTREETIAYQNVTLKSFDVWCKAKADSNYHLYENVLLEVIKMTKERAEKVNPEADSYDVLLDKYEEGMCVKKYDVFFNTIKKELLPLIKRVKENQEKIDDSFLYQYYPIEKQKEFNHFLLKYMGFDEAWGYEAESEHPFTTSISANDSRITVHYYENNLASAIFSAVHEAGHAFYDNHVDKKYSDSVLHDCISMGMHESQSRFNENYIARRKSFWVPLFPKLVELFPEQLKGISLDKFVEAINKSVPSFIRTEADELTYPIHILIRYEIEKEIFSGKVDLSDLSVRWNDLYKEYLGIDVRNDAEGILQDVHWSDGSFGYFPAYALGSAIGAQLLKAMEKEIDVDSLLEEGKYKQIQKWLKNNVQKYGALYNSDEILLKATGEKFKPKYYTDFLKKKYTKLYGIKKI